MLTLDQGLESWKLDLRTANKSDRTVETYELAVSQLLDWLKNQSLSTEVGKITRNDLRAFIGHMLDTRSPATAKQRHGSLSVFFKWLTEEGEIPEGENPMIGVKAPKVSEKPVPVVTEKHFENLIGSCDSTFTGKRDEALIRLLWDSGMRLGELAGLRADDVSLDLEMVWVDGKSGMRRAPYTMGTARSLDRYLRARTKHRFARSPWLWIGERETKAGEMRLTKTGIYQMLARRSEKLGIGHINPHMFRHSAADRFITAGVQEGEVMELLGWSRGSRSMLDRYGKSVASRRAIDTYRRLIG